MRDGPSEVVGELRAAEVVASLCLATDLGMGLPFEHGLQSTVIAMRLAGRVGVDGPTAAQTYYACLLMYAGCTTDAHESAATFGGSLTTEVLPDAFASQTDVLRGVVRALPSPSITGWRRPVQIARKLQRARAIHLPHLAAVCEVAEALAGRLGLPQEIQGLFARLVERWDGKGPLRRGAGDEIPLPLRIVHVARDAALQRLLGGHTNALAVVRARAGAAFDPDVVACLIDDADAILDVDRGRTAWHEALQVEPPPHQLLEGSAIDRTLAAVGDFADLLSPYLSGHSSSVAHMAAEAARRCHLDQATVSRTYRAGLIHDVGRVAVHPVIWQKREPLSADDWEQIRLHPYQTERILAPSPFLAALGKVAAAHHERLDGSGYHRGSTSAALSLPERLLAAADEMHAMTEPRPHRPALTAEQAARELTAAAAAGKLDADAVTVVLAAAGQPAPPLPRPAGLTEREAQVVALLARGLQTKQVASTLSISVKTADHHVQNAYRKIGVSSRAAVTLFAMEHGLIAWGELPMVGRAAPS